MAANEHEGPTTPPPHEATRTSSTLGVPLRRGQRRDTAPGSDAGTAGPALEAGRILGAWTLVRPLGEGGFAEVWEAEESGGRRVALKVLTAMRATSDEAVARFVQEGRLAASLSSPRCVFILGAQAVDGVPAIAMELMPGGSLQDLLKRRGSLPHAEAVEHALDVIEGLEAAQAAGIVHRDVKPSNCFVDRDGRVRIGDFGISKSLETTTKLTQTGSFLGTPSYASPEQIRGRAVDFRSDMYSAGATLYALLTGHAPFESTNAGDLVARIIGDKVPPMSAHGVNVPPGLEAVVTKTLAKDPGARFETFDALRRALLPFRESRTRPAPILRRAIAYAGDSLVIGLLNSLPFFTMGLELGAHGVQPDQEAAMRLASDWRHVAASLCVTVLYLALTETFVGASPCKRLLGLRVEGRHGGSPGWARILLRTLTFVLLTSSSSIAMVVALRAGMGMIAGSMISMPVLLVGTIAMLGTMRPRNGWLGLHEMISGTRVTTTVAAAGPAPSLIQRVRTPAASEPMPDSPARTLGSFTLVGIQTQGPGWTCWRARDESLGRRAWIVEHDAARPMPSPAHERASRLRRLQWGEIDGRRWVALEDPGGASVVRLVTSDGPMHWGHVRLLLVALFEEIELALGRGDLPPALCVRQVWIDAGGRVRLLDVPAEPDPDGHDPEIPADQWPEMLHRLFVWCLDGRWPSGQGSREQRPRGVLPEHARMFVDGICNVPRGLTRATLGNARAWLEHHLDAPHEITRNARLTALGIPAATPAVVAGVALATASLGFGPGPASGNDIVTAAGLAMWMLDLLALPAIILSVALGGGVGMRVAGIALQAVDGRAASRLRCLVRALAAWGIPLAHGLVFVALPWLAPTLAASFRELDLKDWSHVGSAALMLAGAAFAAWLVDRGIPDIIAGTRLVAR